MQQSAVVRDDVTLLNLVAERRDEAAYSELFSRYEKLAYSLALNILGDPRTAEEQVQEAMLRIWSKAGTFRGDGDNASHVKAWMMKIVARECFKTLRKQKRSVREVHQEVEPVSEVSHPDQSASAELTAALQAKLQQLAAADRELIALHFGGGISQSELSKELSISQQTISYRINRILKELRGSLALSGFSAAAVPLSAEFLHSALTSGHAPPRGLYDAVRQRLQSARTVRRARPRRGGSAQAAKWLTLGAVALTCAGGAYWFATPAPKPVTPAAPAAALPQPQPAPVAAIPAAPAVPPPAPIDTRPSGYTFTFTKGLPAPTDMLLLKGTWKWMPERKAIQTDRPALFFFVQKIMPPEPVLLVVKASMVPGAPQSTYGATLHKKGNPLKALRQWREHNTSVPMYERKSYFVDSFLIEYANDHVVRIIEFDQDHDGAEIIMAAGNLLIDSIDLDALDPKKIPAELYHPEKLGEKLVRYDLLSAAEQKKMEDE